MKRHFTVSVFVSDDGHTLLHWHAKNRMWLPPGGHIEPDEDPIEAALREAEEEAGFPGLLLPTAHPFPYADPQQLPAPVTMMVEDIPAAPSEPAHQHLDLIYFARPRDAGLPDPPHHGWRWVALRFLAQNRRLAPPGADPPVEVAEDVRILGLAAIRRALEEGPSRDR